MLKKIFIPGWMDTVDNCVSYDGLEIWKKEIDPKDKIETEYIVAYSIGANFALLNWKENKNTKLILVNPLVPKRNAFLWFLRWLGFLMFEGPSISKKRSACFPYIISGIKKCLIFLFVDSIRIINTIPRENVVVIRGRGDRYFCGKEAASVIRLNNIRLLEVEGAEHTWNGRLGEVADKIISGEVNI
jgi:hypothetical protein